MTFTLGNNHDTSVRQIARTADEAELERPGTGPPAETDALDMAVHPGREPDHLVPTGDHELLAYRLVLPNRPNAGAQMLALATGVVLVAGVAVATFPDGVVPAALRTDAVAQATVPSSGAGVVPRAAQVGDRPPRIAIQVNDRRLITRDWAYYLENRLRERYKLEGVPLVIDFKTSRGRSRD